MYISSKKVGGLLVKWKEVIKTSYTLEKEDKSINVIPRPRRTSESVIESQCGYPVEHIDFGLPLITNERVVGQRVLALSAYVSEK